MIAQLAKTYCQGGLTPREELTKADTELGVFTSETGGPKPTPKDCNDLEAKISKLIPKVKPRDDEDYEINQIPKNVRGNHMRCLARAGDCKAVYQMFLKDTFKTKAELDAYPADKLPEWFEGIYGKCKGKQYK
jgi:hypothetical protein